MLYTRFIDNNIAIFNFIIKLQRSTRKSLKTAAIFLLMTIIYINYLYLCKLFVFGRMLVRPKECYLCNDAVGAGLAYKLF